MTAEDEKDDGGEETACDKRGEVAPLGSMIGTDSLSGIDVDKASGGTCFSVSPLLLLRDKGALVVLVVSRLSRSFGVGTTAFSLFTSFTGSPPEVLLVPVNCFGRRGGALPIDWRFDCCSNRPMRLATL